MASAQFKPPPLPNCFTLVPLTIAVGSTAMPLTSNRQSLPRPSPSFRTAAAIWAAQHLCVGPPIDPPAAATSQISTRAARTKSPCPLFTTLFRNRAARRTQVAHAGAQPTSRSKTSPTAEDFRVRACTARPELVMPLLRCAVLADRLSPPALLDIVLQQLVRTVLPCAWCISCAFISALACVPPGIAAGNPFKSILEGCQNSALRVLQPGGDGPSASTRLKQGQQRAELE